MTRKAPSIASIIEDLGLDGRHISTIVIGLATEEVPEVEVAQAYETLSGPNELPQTLRAALGIVVAPLDYLSRTRSEQLLSRLRDIHCEKVLLIDTACGWRPEELRSLGFLELKRPSRDGRCYLFDPGAFNEPREWNNPSDWANPENFRKYRW